MILGKNDISKSNRIILNTNVYECQKESAKGVYFWGKNNDYPAFFELLQSNSPTAKLCIETKTRFYSGFGFENEEVNKVVIGQDFRGKRLTVLDWLNKIAYYLAAHKGCYTHLTYNSEHKVERYRVIPFRYVRFCKADDSGYSAKMAVYENWENDKDYRDANNRSFDKNKIKYYYVFNELKDVFIAQLMTSDGKTIAEKIQSYCGQIHFLYLDDVYIYPTNPYASVYADLDSEAQNSIFKNSQFRGGFTKKPIFRIPQQINETGEYIENPVTQKLYDLCGVSGDDALVIEENIVRDANGNETLAKTFETSYLETTISPDLFDKYSLQLEEKIRSVDKMPSVLIKFDSGGLGTNNAELVQTYVDLYNSYTQDIRTKISDMAQEIFSLSANPVLSQNQNWTIKPFRLIENGNTNPPAQL